MPDEKRDAMRARYLEVGLTQAAREFSVSVSTVLFYTRDLPKPKPARAVSDEKREAIRKRYSEGVSLKDIATQFGVSIGTVTRVTRDLPGRHSNKGRPRAKKPGTEPSNVAQ